jgi:hypothetical protein
MLKTESCIFGIASPCWEHDRNAVDSRHQQTSLIWPIDSIKNLIVTRVYHMHIILKEFCTKSTKWTRNLTHHCNCESLLQTRQWGHSYRWWEEKPGSLKIESHHELFHLWSIHNDGSAGSPARSWFLFCKCTTQGVKCTSITSSVLHAWAAAVAMCGPNKSCKLNPAYNQEETCLK